MSVKNDNRNLYLKVIDFIKEEIEKGVFIERQKLPSESELSKRLGVSRATLREALRILEEENIITRKHGVGTFVKQKPIFQSGIENLTSVTTMIKKAGKKPGTKLLSTSIDEINFEEKKKLNSDEYKEIVTVKRVRTANGEPVVYCIDKIPSMYFNQEKIIQYESLFDYLENEENIEISYAVTQIEPMGGYDTISDILQCEKDTSLLVLKQIHYTMEDKPIFYSVNFFRADQFVFHVVRKRSHL